ncbi:MAG: HEAT repeat domain-containing protein [Candidatus Thiodiazotropha sp.]
MSHQQSPEVLFLLATGCHHCPMVLESLTQQLKQGNIARLDAVNIVNSPGVAQQLGVRSVPWTRIGRFELDGAMSPKEVAQWVERAANDRGVGDYFSESLAAQRSDKVIRWLEESPEALKTLLELQENEATPMAARIGIGVVMEQLEGDPRLSHALPTLIRQSRSEQANIRADVAHYLGLTQLPDARSVLTEMLNDSHPDVREIAQESLALLNNANG